MLKRIVKILVIFVLICGILISLTACGEEKTKTEAKSKASSGFLIKYKGVDITPGKSFDETEISETAEKSEIPSCAFDGVDKVYTYPEVEITVAEIDGKDTIYSVYFIDENIATNEGVKISDPKDFMLEKYGNDYENSLSTKFDYVKNGVTLSFIVENDIITGIEYVLYIK